MQISTSWPPCASTSRQRPAQHAISWQSLCKSPRPGTPIPSRQPLPSRPLLLTFLSRRGNLPHKFRSPLRQRQICVQGFGALGAFGCTWPLLGSDFAGLGRISSRSAPDPDRPLDPCLENPYPGLRFRNLRPKSRLRYRSLRLASSQIEILASII